MHTEPGENQEIFPALLLQLPTKYLFSVSNILPASQLLLMIPFKIKALWNFCKNCLVKSRFNPSNLQHFSKFPFYNFHFFCFRQHEIEAAEPSPAKSWKYFATNLLFLKINFLLLYEKITDTINIPISRFFKILILLSNRSI